MSDLVAQPMTGAEPGVELWHPDTGEVIDLRSASASQLAEWLTAIREWESKTREAKSLVSIELHERFDRAAKWSIREDGFLVSGESPERIEYDPALLRDVLGTLVDANSITPDAADAALKREVTFKPSKRGINALLKLGGNVADAINGCRMEVTRPRRITVKRG